MDARALFGFTLPLARNSPFKWHCHFVSAMARPVMQKFFRSGVLLFLIFVSGALLAAEKTNEVKTVEESEAAEQARRAYLQLQEQLHATQLAIEQTRLAIEQTRQETSDSAGRNAETIATRLKLIEETLAFQREREIEAMQKSNRLILTGAAIFGGIGILALVFTAWFLLRAMNRLSQIAASFPIGHALGPGAAAAALGGGHPHLVGFGSADLPGPRLLGAIERLEKRIHKLESIAQSPSTNEARHDEHINPGQSHRGESERSEKISLMLGKGQALLHMDQPENALACFDQVLTMEPNHADALIKRGTALERLKRLDEALECYDRAIAANSSMTLAYLYKGGIFNQLERFSEALECYEQALRHQQKTTVT